jgi:hypothetical protein
MTHAKCLRNFVLICNPDLNYYDRRSVKFVLYWDASIPIYRGLRAHLEFNELSSLSPVFIRAALETAVLLPKFIGARPNALRQRKRFHVKPHYLMIGFAHISWPGSAFFRSKLLGNTP